LCSKGIEPEEAQMSKETEAAIQLRDRELDEMRKHVRAAEENLRHIARITGSKLRPHSPHRAVKQTRFIFDNVRVVIDWREEGGTCDVYEDPPGICRQCRPGE
jgi:hypothetical protein